MASTGSDLMFNQAPMIKGKKAPAKKVKKRTAFQLSDDESLQIEKHVKPDQNLFEDQDTFFSKFNQDFLGYFLDNKMSLKAQDKIHPLVPF